MTIRWNLLALITLSSALATCPGCLIAKLFEGDKQVKAQAEAEPVAAGEPSHGAAEAQPEPAADEPGAPPRMAKPDEPAPMMDKSAPAAADESGAPPMMAKPAQAEPMMAKPDEPAPMMDKSDPKAGEGAKAMLDKDAPAQIGPSKGPLLLGEGLSADLCVNPPVSQPRVMSELKVGQPAPLFSLKDMKSDQVVSLAELKGRHVLINVWVSWCPKCRAMSRRFGKPLHQWASQTPDAKLQLISLGLSVGDDTAAKQLAVSKSEPFPWPFLFDEGERLLDAFGINAQPSYVLIGPEGTVQSFGELNDERANQLAGYLKQACLRKP